VAIAGVIHDVTDFVNEHPGGKALIKSAIGNDALN
jgi:stearoyl-CoA desaturase (delta-9 desaturase)